MAHSAHENTSEIVQFVCETDKIVCCRFYSLWHFYPNLRETHEKMVTYSSIAFFSQTFRICS